MSNISLIVATELLNRINDNNLLDFYAHLESYPNIQIIKISKRLALQQPLDCSVRGALQRLHSCFIEVNITANDIAIYHLRDKDLPYQSFNTDDEQLPFPIIHELNDPQAIQQTLIKIQQIIDSHK